jgi:hypothetical protein
MMRLWRETYTKPAFALALGGAAFSLIAHTTVIAAWIVATMPGAGMSRTSLANRIFYIPPPPRPFGSRLTHETVQFITLARGTGTGDGPRHAGLERPTAPDGSAGSAPPPVDTAQTVTPPPPPVGHDSIFTIADVDTAVVRMANSAAPAYPLDMLQQHVTGMVYARYVVDTTGFADPSSFTVLHSTNGKFTSAVRDALPYMRFRSAKIGTLKVRQLVEQQFSFRIAGDTVRASAPPTAARRKP